MSQLIFHIDIPSTLRKGITWRLGQTYSWRIMWFYELIRDLARVNAILLKECHFFLVSFPT